MKVLGIDPGTAALGYGIVERSGGRLREVDHGVLNTSPDLSLPERLLAIHSLVDELLSLHEPDFMGVERLFFSRNVQTALGVGQARGVVLLAAAHGPNDREATPNRVKGGRGWRRRQGRSTHGQLVLGMGELPRPDAADALAIATWVANTDRGVYWPRRFWIGQRSRRSPVVGRSYDARSARRWPTSAQRSAAPHSHLVTR